MDFVFHPVQLDVGKSQNRLFNGPTSTSESTESREEFRKIEWLGEIIVSSDIETVHHVLTGIPCGENENWCGVAVRPKLRRHFEPALAGQHHVDDDHVILAYIRMGETLLSIRGYVDHVSFLQQATLDERGDPGIILDNQNFHRVPIRSNRSSTSNPNRTALQPRPRSGVLRNLKVELGRIRLRRAYTYKLCLSKSGKNTVRHPVRFS